MSSLDSRKNINEQENHGGKGKGMRAKGHKDKRAKGQKGKRAKGQRAKGQKGKRAKTTNCNFPQTGPPKSYSDLSMCC